MNTKTAINLPRQARDKHIGKALKKIIVFTHKLQGICRMLEQRGVTVVYLLDQVRLT